MSNTFDPTRWLKIHMQRIWFHQKYLPNQEGKYTFTLPEKSSEKIAIVNILRNDEFSVQLPFNSKVAIVRWGSAKLDHRRQQRVTAIGFSIILGLIGFLGYLSYTTL